MSPRRKVLNVATVLSLMIFAPSALTGLAFANPSVPRPDMACIAKTGNPQELTQGVPGQIMYSIKVKNVGYATANGVTITDVLPLDVVFDSAEDPCTENGGTVTCYIGDVGSNVEVTKWILVNALDPQPDNHLTNVASVSADKDSYSGNDGGPESSCQVSTAVVQQQGEADMQCDFKTGNPQVLTQGLSQDITYEVRVSNVGGEPATNVVITDTLPAGVDFGWASPACEYDNAGTVTCDFDGVDPNQDVTVQIVVNSTSHQAGDVLTNVASVSADNDQNPDNNGGAACEAIATVVEQPGGDEGCTPGYWKNHLDSWCDGYEPGDPLDELFETSGHSGPVKYLDGDLDDDGNRDTLFDALSFEGGCGPSENCTKNGAARILTRAAVAAVLNACNPDVAYPNSVAAIVADVDAALMTGNRTFMLLLAGALDADNNRGCPLN